MPEVMEVLNDVKTGLKSFRDFLESPGFGQIESAIKQVAAKFPVINTLIDQLVSLMDQVKTEVDKLDPQNNLAQVPTFMQEVEKLLEGAESLFEIPAELTDAIEAVSGVAEILQEIRDAIPVIKTKLAGLKG